MNDHGRVFGRILPMKVGHLNFKQTRLFCVLAISLLTAQLACAQGKAKSTAPAVPPPACVIAEFRYIALTHHDPLERQNKIIDWLFKNGSSCSPEQMAILISSKATLLGTSDSVTLAAVIDRIVEKKIGSDYASLSRYYRPEVQAPAKGREDAPAVATTESGPGPSPGTGVPPAAGGPAAR